MQRHMVNTRSAVDICVRDVLWFFSRVPLDTLHFLRMAWTPRT